VADHAESEARIADRDRQQDRERDRPEAADPGREAPEVPEERGRVGADAEEGAVAEGDEAEATHEGPGGADERPDQDLDQHVEDVRPQAPHRDPGRRPEPRKQTERARGANRYPRRIKMPPGRAKISTMNTANAMTY